MRDTSEMPSILRCVRQTMCQFCHLTDVYPWYPGILPIHLRCEGSCRRQRLCPSLRSAKRLSSVSPSCPPTYVFILFNANAYPYHIGHTPAGAFIWGSRHPSPLVPTVGGALPPGSSYLCIRCVGEASTSPVQFCILMVHSCP